MEKAEKKAMKLLRKYDVKKSLKIASVMSYFYAGIGKTKKEELWRSIYDQIISFEHAQ